MKPKLMSQERFTHVHKIDDFVLQDVREFIVNYHTLATLDVQLSLSDFLTCTRKPYRAKSKMYDVWKQKSPR